MIPLFLAFARFGYSCGHDIPFHLQSWQDAASQLRHGIYPQWDITAAHGVGEPRFIFYPPISWLLGAVLSIVVGIPRSADAFVIVALLCCGLSMFLSLRRYVGVPVAIAAAVFFALNPYMLFNALERSAFGELLASAWLPLLAISAIQPRPRVRSIAVPFALLWLTNVPTAIIGSYLLLGIVCLRLVQGAFLQRDSNSDRGLSRRYLSVCVLGAVLGLLATGFFLVPALHQQHYVQLSAAFSEGLDYKDSFLLRHTPLSSRQVTHSVSWIAAELLGFFAVGSVAMVYLTKKLGSARNQRFGGLLALIVLAAVVTFLLLPPSSAVWAYAPELSVLQFPWRLLGVIAMLCSFLLAMLLDTVADKRIIPLLTAFVLGWLLAISGQRQYWLYPNAPDHEGLSREQVAAATERRPTNEYTPMGASNSSLNEADKGYWIGDQMPHNSSSTSADLQVQDESEAPQHLQVNLPRPEELVLNLRNYPSWEVTANGQHLPVDPRPDGRMSLSLPAGVSSLDVRWHRGVDEIGGLILSLLAASAIWMISRKEREIN